ncbi:hypothetical protein L9F63_024072 [Diploptera punctata]|uniref:Transcription initiation protein SPT3 homolog n=1 Tax=Diploptera punctata TaxID=6984 RepID=A0AAD7ZHT3_DIPPU|nr:hypothetical protein L9F63_024072 [Diploptera punctata]
MSGAENATEAVSSDEPVNVQAYIVSKIQSMMYGFGDAQVPLLETACLVGNIVQQQMRSMINHASDVAAMRGVKTIGLEEFIFLMRKDRVKLHRLLKYMDMKDVKNKVTGILDEDAEDPELALDTPNRKLSQICMDFLSSIDSTGELIHTGDLPADIVKYERQVRAERTSRTLDRRSYVEFVNARCSSFTNMRSGSKFRDWLQLNADGSHSELPKITNNAYDLLGYLAYETVAQLVDLALLVRQDEQMRAGDAISRYVPGIGYSARHSLDSQQIETAAPLTPAEVREAVRRYWHSPMGSSLNFTRNITCQVDTKLFCC